MLGISYGTSSNASLLGNFEIVATTVITPPPQFSKRRFLDYDGEPSHL